MNDASQKKENIRNGAREKVLIIVRNEKKQKTILDFLGGTVNCNERGLNSHGLKVARVADTNDKTIRPRRNKIVETIRKTKILNFQFGANLTTNCNLQMFFETFN